MTTPYAKVQDFDAVPAAQDNYLELKVPHRGIINQLVVKDTSGTDGFTYDLYSKQINTTPTPEPDPELFEVIPQQVITAGNAVSSLQDVAYAYDNQDGTSTNPVRRLWLKLNPLGAGTKDFRVSITVIPPM